MVSDDFTVKQCAQCKLIKKTSLFSVRSRAKDGLQSYCKQCGAEGKRLYAKTKKGLISKIYRTQKRNSKERNHDEPNYSLCELRDWAMSQSIFHELFDLWETSGYKKILIPSFDRLDDYKPYTFDNLQILTWGENLEKSHADMKNGINNKQSKAVLQIDADNAVVERHHSVRSAVRKTGVAQSSIILCCMRKRRLAGGFKWEYESKNSTNMTLFSSQAVSGDVTAAGKPTVLLGVLCALTPVTAGLGR